MTAPARPAPASPLSERQMAVLRHAADGASIPETATALHLAVGTVHYHQQVICTRLRARNIRHAVHLAHLLGLLGARQESHGDHAGYARHVYRGEDPRACPLGCWEGEQEYQAERRAARRAALAARAAAAGGGQGCRVSAGRTRTSQ